MKIEGVAPHIELQDRPQLDGYDAYCTVCQSVIGFYDLLQTQEAIRKDLAWHDESQEHIRARMGKEQFTDCT